MKNAEAKIVKATFHLISDKPFHSVTTEEIIKTAEVAKASFYYYFRDKYDVAVSCMKEVVYPSLKKPDNISQSWSARVLDIQRRAIKAKAFMMNALKIDMAHYLFMDMTKYYANCLIEHISAMNVDVEKLEIKKAIQNLAQVDIMTMYQYCIGKIRDKELIEISKLWKSWIPLALVPYLK